MQFFFQETLDFKPSNESGNNFFSFNLQAGWKENQATFMAELKNLQATGLSTLGASLKEAFDLLNLYRLQSGIDNYGMVSHYRSEKIGTLVGICVYCRLNVIKLTASCFLPSSRVSFNIPLPVQLITLIFKINTHLIMHKCFQS